MSIHVSKHVHKNLSQADLDPQSSGTNHNNECTNLSVIYERYVIILSLLSNAKDICSKIVKKGKFENKLTRCTLKSNHAKKKTKNKPPWKLTVKIMLCGWSYSWWKYQSILFLSSCFIRVNHITWLQQHQQWQMCCPTDQVKKNKGRWF